MPALNTIPLDKLTWDDYLEIGAMKAIRHLILKYGAVMNRCRFSSDQLARGLERKGSLPYPATTGQQPGVGDQFRAHRDSPLERVQRDAPHGIHVEPLDEPDAPYDSYKEYV